MPPALLPCQRHVSTLLFILTVKELLLKSNSLLKLILTNECLCGSSSQQLS